MSILLLIWILVLMARHFEEHPSDCVLDTSDSSHEAMKLLRFSTLVLI